MKRSIGPVESALHGVFSICALCFTLSLCIAMLNPVNGAIFAYVACVFGFVATMSMAAIIYTAVRL